MKKNKLPYDHKNPFQVPEQYFGSLEDRIMARATSAKDQDEDIRLQSDKAETGFKVPENYFETFEDRLMSKIDTRPKQSKVISLLNRESFYYVAGAAAVFVAIVTTLFSSPAQPLGFEDLDVVSIEGYLHETLEFSTTDVSQYFNEGEFSFAPSGRSDVDQEAVIEYLHENIEEPSILFNEE